MAAIMAERVRSMFGWKKKKSAARPGSEDVSIEPGTVDAEEKAPPALGSRNRIESVIAVISGKGGVGKSSTTALLASGLIMRGYRVGILDADITGPSIPRMYGVSRARMGKNDFGIIPVEHRLGLKMMSLNLFLSDETDPAIWRGPRIAGAIQEFYNQVDWGQLDYLLIDMPPGTADAAISVLQNIPLTAAIVVTTPHDLAFSIVRKAYKMLVKHNIPILGVVENFKTGVCPACQHELALFSGGDIEQWCEQHEVSYLAGIPWDQKLAVKADAGNIDSYYSKDSNRLVEGVISKTRKGA